MDCQCSPGVPCEPCRQAVMGSERLRALIREEIAAYFREQKETRRRFDRAALRMTDKADPAHTPNTVDPL